MTYMHLISLVLRGLHGTQDSEIFMALTRLCVALQLCHMTQTVCVGVVTIIVFIVATSGLL